MSLLTELVSDVGDADGTVVDGLTLVFGLNCPQKESYCSFSPGVSSNGTNLSFLVTVAVALGAGAETLALDKPQLWTLQGWLVVAAMHPLAEAAETLQGERWQS